MGILIFNCVIEALGVGCQFQLKNDDPSASPPSRHGHSDSNPYSPSPRVVLGQVRDPNPVDSRDHVAGVPFLVGRDRRRLPASLATPS
jgi:hypothetical protein